MGGDCNDVPWPCALGEPGTDDSPQSSSDVEPNAFADSDSDVEPDSASNTSTNASTHVSPDAESDDSAHDSAHIRPNGLPFLEPDVSTARPTCLQKACSRSN